MENKWGVKPFSGEGFSYWKFRVNAILEENECSIDTLKSLDMNGKNTQKKNSKAKSIIIQCLGNNQLEIIHDCTTAVEMMRKLMEKYEQKTLAEKLFLKKKLMNMKFEEKEDLEKFLTEYDELLRKLSEADVKMDDSEKICSLLLTLPKSFDYVVAAIETLVSKEEITLEFVKTRLLDHHSKRKDIGNQEVENKKHEGSTTTTAFASFRFNCYNCGKIGHKKSECKFKKKKFSQNEYEHAYEFKKHDNKHSYEDKNENKGKQSVLLDENKFAFLIHNSELAKSCDLNTVRLVVDSGATDHIINDERVYSVCHELESPVYISTAKNGPILKAYKIGDIHTEECVLKNVLYAPDLSVNLLSVQKLVQSGAEVTFKKDGVYVIKNQKPVFTSNLPYPIFYVDFRLKQPCHSANQAFAVKSSNIDWHRRLGHVSDSKLDILLKNDYIKDKLKSSDENVICETCVKSKQTRLPFKDTHFKSSHALELVHSDICGPIDPISYTGKKYVLTLLDDYTHFTVVYLLENKSDVTKYFEEYTKMVSAKFNRKIHRLRCDNGKEYDNNDMKNICKQEGIKIEFTIPYTPEQNGKAERLNRTLFEKARALVNDAGMEKELWDEAILTATYLINRIPTVDGKVPAELWFGYKPDYSKLKIFGCTAHLHVPKEKRDKLDEKSVKLKMIGYTDNGYKLWNEKNRTIIRGRDIIFDETQSQEDENIDSNSEVVDVPVSRSVPNVNHGNSKRARKPPAWHKDYDFTEENHGAYFSCADYVEQSPITKEEAMARSDSEKWKAAIQEELDSHKKYNTWEVVPRPEKRKVIDSKWVFKVKTNMDGTAERYKARLVAKGFQSSDYKETYSPVAKLTTFRVLMSIANHYDYEVVQMDVKTAFLNGTLEEEIYMNLPEDMYNPNLVCRGDKFPGAGGPGGRHSPLTRNPPSFTRTPSKRYQRRLVDSNGTNDEQHTGRPLVEEKETEEDLSGGLSSGFVTGGSGVYGVSSELKSVSVPQPVNSMGYHPTRSDSPRSTRSAPWNPSTGAAGNTQHRGLFSQSPRSVRSAGVHTYRHSSRKKRSSSVESRSSNESKHCRRRRRSSRGKRGSDNESEHSRCSSSRHRRRNKHHHSRFRGDKGDLGVKGNIGVESRRPVRRNRWHYGKIRKISALVGIRTHNLWVSKNAPWLSTTKPRRYELVDSESQWKQVQLRRASIQQAAIVRPKSGYMNSGLETESEYSYHHQHSRRKQHRKHSSRSRSPSECASGGSKPSSRLPPELARALEFSLVDTEGMSAAQLRSIPYTEVKTSSRVKLSPVSGRKHHSHSSRHSSRSKSSDKEPLPPSSASVMSEPTLPTSGPPSLPPPSSQPIGSLGERESPPPPYSRDSSSSRSSLNMKQGGGECGVNEPQAQVQRTQPVRSSTRLILVLLFRPVQSSFHSVGNQPPVTLVKSDTQQGYALSRRPSDHTLSSSGSNSGRSSLRLSHSNSAQQFPTARSSQHQPPTSHSTSSAYHWQNSEIRGVGLAQYLPLGVNANPPAQQQRYIYNRHESISSDNLLEATKSDRHRLLDSSTSNRTSSMSSDNLLNSTYVDEESRQCNELIDFDNRIGIEYRQGIDVRLSNAQESYRSQQQSVCDNDNLALENRLQNIHLNANIIDSTNNRVVDNRFGSIDTRSSNESSNTRLLDNRDATPSNNRLVDNRFGSIDTRSSNAKVESGVLKRYTNTPSGGLFPGRGLMPLDIKGPIRAEDL
ncbi:hypothetical protein WDU94_000417 [Cyamophila willieti]